MTRKWWHNKVAYQIYPKSFCDSNGDGIGDLPGIISRLDYLKDLGVDILWLSPCYQSPLADQGYDISDYYQIDPRFGTMEDMDRLIAEAKKRDMYILMDLVVNHCSDEHVWFQKACQDPDGPYGSYFYLADRTEGKRPTNWRSYFGGSVWEDLPGTGKQYLHVFHKKQPDLNWENPQVREEIYQNICWWLDKGLGGFRLDAIINIKKALPLRDYEPDREDGLCSVAAMLKEAKGIGGFLGEMRDRTFSRYDVFTVGEVFDEKPEEIPDFIGENGYFSSMFDFNETIFGASPRGWYDARRITPEDYKRCCFDAQARVGTMGFLSNIIENHDEPRGVSRYIPEGDCCPESKKMLAGLNFLLRGIPFIYQGQELGMENVPFQSIHEIDDISTLDEYRTAREAGLSEEAALQAVAYYSRDNARTPMQWTDGANAGFTTGTPWLRVNPNYKEINAAAQMEDKDSVRSFYKELIRLRKSPDYGDTLVYGTLEPVWVEVENLMAYYRKGDRTLLVAGNFQRKARTVELAGACCLVLNNLPGNPVADGRLCLEGYQFVVLELLP
ncbi:MAG: alpha-glucosidase [Lachnospiraceae bacterium]|nr:alpha-glucosidase [Lachnospiraceae bacterium]